MRRSIALVVVVAAALVGGVFVARVPAQQPAPAQTELLAEVRLLRQAIESLAGVNARVQIVFGRLQMQEQRTEGVARRLDGVRLQLNSINGQLSRTAEEIKTIEADIAEGRRKPQELETLQIVVREHRRAIERLEGDRARLMIEEQDIANTLNQEQGRWSDLNRQLDELEKQLSKPQQ